MKWSQNIMSFLKTYSVKIVLINPLPFTLLSQMKSNPFKPENNMDQFILILKPEIILKRDRKFFATQFQFLNYSQSGKP